MEVTYSWIAGLVTILGVVGVIVAGRFFVFRIPTIAGAREFNNIQDKEKWRSKGKKYHHRIKSSQKIALAINLIFYLGILPFLVTLQAQPVWKVIWDVFSILMIYDFLYYVTHRFLFHGKGYLRKVHAVHHQARSRVSSIDSLLLHPWEIFIGIALFYFVIATLALFYGKPFHVATLIICNVIYTQINQINHCRIDLDKKPWKFLSWIAIKHDAHHIDMHRGNYATITLVYDWMFRTLETHPLEQAAGKSSS